MIKEIKHNGKKYQINTTPEGRWHAEIHEIDHVEVSGILAEVWKELGQTMTRTERFEISEEEVIEVALELGWKFSRSKQWQRLISWAGYKQRKGCNG